MMKVKIIDAGHEKELEKNINTFLSNTKCDIINIQFTTAIAVFAEEQIYCFSAMILYEE